MRYGWVQNKFLFRECAVVNISHVVYANGTTQARCSVSCGGEIGLSVGLTVLVASCLWVLIRRIYRYYKFLSLS